MDDIFNYLASDNYIVVNKSLIKIFGLEEAILLGELCSEYKYWLKSDKLEDDMFYSSIKNIEDNTGLTAYQQRKAIQSLTNAGILETKLKGLPAKKYFKIDFSTVVKYLTSCSDKISQQETKILHRNNNKEKNKEINNKDSSQKLTDWFIETYHATCVSLPKVRVVTDKRKKAIQKILKKYSKQDIIECLRLAEQTDFLKGKNDRGWKADIDFILREDKFVSILEHKYGNSKPSNSAFSEGDGLSSDGYTQEEKDELYKKAIEREQNGQRGLF